MQIGDVRDDIVGMDDIGFETSVSHRCRQFLVKKFGDGGDACPLRCARDVVSRLDNNGQIAFRYSTVSGAKPGYPENPNGSVEDIAGITDKTGRVLGLMPHPERHFLFTHHPYWTRLEKTTAFGDGAKIFENGVKFARENLV